MKYKSAFLYSVLAVVLVLTAFGVGKASATTGCFTDTNGHWAESFICWMSDNGITSGTGPGTFSPEATVTRAQMSVFMKRLDDLAVSQANAAASAALSNGTTFMMSGLNNWQGYGDSGSYVRYFRNAIVLHAPAAGIYGFTVTGDLPGSIYNHEMWLNGVKLCYDATHGAALTKVDLQHITGGASPSIWNEVTDNTSRTDLACRTYSFTSASSLWGVDHVVLYVEANFPTAGDQLWVQAVDFILSPSSSSGVPVAPGSDSTESRPKPDTNAPTGSDPDSR